jgi:hypothetical protein
MTGALLVNPIMGHVQISLSSPLLWQRSLWISTRYEVNVHSIASELVAALHFVPVEGLGSIRLRASTRHGIGMLMSLGTSGTSRLEVSLSSGSISPPRPSVHFAGGNIGSGGGPSIGISIAIEP